LFLNEPVRGQVPPPWFWALSGLERIEALTQGLVPLPPLCRLLGIRPAHVGPGLGTWTMPASEWLQVYKGEIDVTALAAVALEGVAMTTVAPAVKLEQISVEMNFLRPTRPQAGNLLARARVLNTNPFFVLAEVQVEDPQGRHVLFATGHAEIQPMEPSPPEPPGELHAVEEAVYPTPDPYLRACPVITKPRSFWDSLTGPDHLRAMLESGNVTPVQRFFGWNDAELSEGFGRSSLQISEWFSLFQRTVHPSVIGSALGAMSNSVGTTFRRPGESFSGFTHVTRFLRTLEADGSRLEVTGRGRRMDNQRVETFAELLDGSGRLIARDYAFGYCLDASKRRRPRVTAARRTLYTLLFTDIVDSTRHLGRLGDAKWRELLDEHHGLLRAEIARHHGAEVDTQGDGFFAKFTSPAQALECARAARDAVRTLGIDIRAGLHTGECEERGAELAGLAVHLAARIQSKAGPGEILVSGTLKELVAGSGSKFADRGEHELKGIDGPWRLWALEV
jgi:class 3 adenylate cyclase/acyl-coenzyme A thioesterase PaaI-like protein